MRKETILVIGAQGQIGIELTNSLRQLFGRDQVISADLRPTSEDLQPDGPYEQLDVLDKKGLAGIVDYYQITQVYLLAAMLSATSEQHPQRAWELNMQSLLNTLDLAHEKKLKKVFWPSSIAVFGIDAPKQNCPQQAPRHPSTVYGISKAVGESWCAYYRKRYGVDVRSLRYPGLISHTAPPGGGTTDYAVDIFHAALKRGAYDCFLNEHTQLPMMYMPDAIRGTLELMQADPSTLTVHGAYNLSAMSFSPAQLASAIREHIPGLFVDYRPDHRQNIAEGWPESIDDTAARIDWHWEHQYGLASMTTEMLHHLAKKTTPDSSSHHYQPSI